MSGERRGTWLGLVSPVQSMALRPVPTPVHLFTHLENEDDNHIYQEPWGKGDMPLVHVSQ